MKAWRLPPFLTVFLFLLLAFGGLRAYYFLTDDFYLGNISKPYLPRPEWEIPTTLSDTELKEILSQPYHYIGKGAQCYAFASEDGEYIVKFFKFKHLRPHFLWSFLPQLAPFISWKQQEAVRKDQRMTNTFSGYALAFQQFGDLSQIVHLHLNPSEKELGPIHLSDKLGRKWEIPTDTTPFLVQRKGKILRTVLSDFLKQGENELAKEALEKIFFMYLTEYRSGAYDRDHGIMHNTGFVGETPFHLDVGKFCLNESMRNTETYSRDLSFVIWKMNAWLKDHFPKETPELIGHLAQLFQEETGTSLMLDQINPQDFQRKKKRL